MTRVELEGRDGILEKGRGREQIRAGG